MNCCNTGSSCILSQVHVPDFDIQGGLNLEQKLHLVEFGLRHLRHHNPNAYIIFSGHGYRPNNLDLADWVYWEDRCRPLDEQGYVAGMPAQFVFVSKGLEHAQKSGFRRCLKTRGDCLIDRPDTLTYCENVLADGGKRLLITQQTGNQERMGDCYMYGDLALMCKIWDETNPVHSWDGLQNTARNFRRAVLDYTTSWMALIRELCAFRDVHKLPLICMRWNYRELDLTEERCQAILDGTVDLSPFTWGYALNWNRFDSQENMVVRSSPDFICAKEFYQE